ncbi:P22 phage major capsid protein family protein [Streptomyces sp. 6N106]|uniref:P22 phage major capsid protein family protein n=1 Tax=Streptomyces sp. 6N106 TaxID=3457418 RepID=UPI003FD4BEE0
MAANTFLKPEVIASASVGLLERELVLSNLVWTNHGLDFTGAKNDTVSLRIPARTAARTLAWRANRDAVDGSGDVVLDTLAEDSISVSLNTDIYSAVPVTDEEMTLDIRDFGSQILDPQVRAVAAYLDNKVATMITGATYASTTGYTYDAGEGNTSTDILSAITTARKLLNLNDVPQEGRTLLVGANFEERLLNSASLLDVSQSGSEGALREATIGRLRGFTIVVSNAVGADDAYAFVPSAFILATRAPVIPQGATFGASASHAGYAMRWIRDYDANKLRDRSIVNAFAGTQVVLDQHVPGVPDASKVLKRAVKITGSEFVPPAG